MQYLSTLFCLLLLFTHACPVTEFAVASHLNTANSCFHHVFLRHFRFQKCLPANSHFNSSYRLFFIKIKLLNHFQLVSQAIFLLFYLCYYSDNTIVYLHTFVFLSYRKKRKQNRTKFRFCLHFRRFHLGN